MKTYILFIRDHTGSMGRNARAALKDYNETIAAIKGAAEQSGQDTIVSVLECGTNVHGQTVNQFAVKNSSINALKPLEVYKTDGSSTPLWDAIAMGISYLKNMPDADDKEVSFVVQVLTDGQDNSSRSNTGRGVGLIMKQLQDTDRWSFLFRVPEQYNKDALVDYGIHRGNIAVWDTQDEKSLEQSTQATVSGYNTFFAARAAGQTSVKSFYSDLSQVNTEEVKANLIDVSNQVTFWQVSEQEDGLPIRVFVESRNKGVMKKGAAFYQLTKPERRVQEKKIICIRDKSTGAVYSGVAARNLLNLPHVGDIKLIPADHGKYDIFIQSTSVNRVLVKHTSVMYWENAGVDFKPKRN